MAKRIILILLVIAWAITIYGFSSVNSRVSGEQVMALFKKVSYIPYKVLRFLGVYNNTQYENESLSHFTTRNYMVFRKVCHAFVYFILAILLFKTLRAILNFKHRNVALISIGICIIYSILDEIHQNFVSGRTSSIWDCVIDNIGSIIGVILSICLYKITINIRKRNQNKKLEYLV